MNLPIIIIILTTFTFLNILYSEPAYGAITIDTGNISTSSTDADPVTFSHTIASGNDVAIVVTVSVESGVDVSDVDWGATFGF